MRTGPLSRSRARLAPVVLEPLELRSLLAADSPFQIVMMPDTQIYTYKYPDIFNAQTQWVAANAAPQNFKFLTHVGDVVQNASLSAEWARADGYMDKLDTVP